MTRPRIGIFVKNDDPGSGPGRYVRSLIRAIDPVEFETVRISTEARDGVPGRREEYVRGMSRSFGGSVVRGLAPYALRYSMGFEREAHRLAEAFRREPVDLLHTSETGCEESAVPLTCDCLMMAGSCRLSHSLPACHRRPLAPCLCLSLHLFDTLHDRP